MEGAEGSTERTRNTRSPSPKTFMTDASSYGLGGLLQQNEDGKWAPISCTSRIMKKAEHNYTPTEKECLAIVNALQKWRHYLHGEDFLVVAKHLALKCLMSLKEPRERLARSVLEIQNYDFSVEHRERKELVVPDTLSRDAVPKPLCQRFYSPLSGNHIEALANAEEEERVANVSGNLSTWHEERVAAVVEVQRFVEGPTKEELHNAQEQEFGDLREYAKDHLNAAIDENEVLCIANGGDLAVLVPRSLVQQVLRHVYGSRLQGHYKLSRMLAKLKGSY